MSTTENHTVRLSEAKKYIKHTAVNRRRPVMLWGPPGIGKSEVVASIVDDIQEKGKTSTLIDVRLPLWEPTDIKGIPYYNQDLKTMTWAQPSELPSEEFAKDYDVVVLFLDELNGAAPSVQAAAYQLILNRRVGEYRLPDNVVIVAAGNRETDKGVTYRMPKPLANRFVHFEVRVNFDDWLNWATNKGVHPDVVGYLTYKKSDLFSFNPKSPEHSFPTPRSWAFVSEILEDVDDFREDEITDMVTGTIGEGTALQFAAHRRTSALLPDPFKVLEGKVKEIQTKEVSAMFSLATSLAYELKTQKDEVGRNIDKKTFNTYCDNALGFCLEHFEPEMVAMMITMVVKNYKVNFDMKELKNWSKFVSRYGDLVLKD